MRLKFTDQPSTAEGPLPEYDRPPVVETAVGIQFDGLVGYTSLSAADFWADLRHDYPAVEERPPLEPAFETFGPSDSRMAVPRFEMVTGAIQPRFFFVSKDESELVQLQKDRLHYNWRRTEKGETYPRYTHVREQLELNLERLLAWAERNRLGQIVPTQCEAVYVNRIPLVDAGGKHCGLSFIFPWLNGSCKCPALKN